MLTTRNASNLTKCGYTFAGRQSHGASNYFTYLLDVQTLTLYCSLPNYQNKYTYNIVIKRLSPNRPNVLFADGFQTFLRSVEQANDVLTTFLFTGGGDLYVEDKLTLHSELIFISLLARTVATGLWLLFDCFKFRRFHRSKSLRCRCRAAYHWQFYIHNTTLGRCVEKRWRFPCHHLDRPRLSLKWRATVENFMVMDISWST